MIKGYTAKRNASVKAKSRTTTAPARRGRPKKETPPEPVNPMQPAQSFPLLIPEQLRTCLMAKEDVEEAVRKVLKEVRNEYEQEQGQRKVYASEVMERLSIDSRSTLHHWDKKGFLKKEHDENGHVFYREYKIRRAERGEHPEEGGSYGK